MFIAERKRPSPKPKGRPPMSEESRTRRAKFDSGESLVRIQPPKGVPQSGRGPHAGDAGSSPALSTNGKSPAEFNERWEHIPNDELLKLCMYGGYCKASRKSLNLPSRVEAKEEILRRLKGA